MYDYRGLDGTGTASNPASGNNIAAYIVRKLADGNCWMTSNLKLTLPTSHAYEVATFSGGTASWTPNSGSIDAYNVAMNGNTICTNEGGDKKCWYNWYAATAGQGTQTSNPTISQSICPKGWKLPNSSNFQSIVNTYSATTPDRIKAFPLEYTAVGLYNAGSLDASSNGYYWSASPYTSNSGVAYNLRFDTSSVNPQSYGGKTSGFSVRCVAIP